MNRKKRALFYLLAFTFCIVAVAVVYVGFVVQRTRPFYSSLKTSQRGWSGKVHQADAELGFAPVPNSRGAEVFPIGPELPMRYDEDGFRAPVSKRSASTRPLVLTLGCSFTYGSASDAEDTYPYLVGQHLGGTVKNAAVSGYGLSQMMILAKRLVPIHRPDYLIVQYSPWLTQRAQNPFAPTYFGKLPVPFFQGGSEVALHPPVFETKTMDLPVADYRKSSESTGDFVSFLWNVGLPLYVHDDFHMLSYEARRKLGAVPEPATNGQQIEKYTYEEIGRVARENKAKVIVVLLGRTIEPVTVAENIFPDDFIVADAQAALIRHLPRASAETYQEQYAHWRGSPPRLVDAHPNARAHRIIADEILSKMKK